jgi:hypothetical protein
MIVYDGWNDSTIRQLSPYRNVRYALYRSFASALGYFFTVSEFELGTGELLLRVSNKLWSSKADSIPSLSTPFDPRKMEFYDLNRQAFLALADDQLSVALFLQPLVGIDDRTLSAEEKASWWYPTLDEALRNRVPFYEHARHTLEDLEARDQGNGYHCIADLSHSLKGVSEPVYADTGHLLPRGNEVVAAHILDQLVLCRLLR